MATKRPAGRKAGATKKGVGKKAGASRKAGASKKAGARGLGSVLSDIGHIAGTIGGIARRRELRVGVPRGGGINDIVTELRKKFREAGCPMCRSGIDRLVLEDIVTRGGGR